jgi:CheY-like chemotaxis protein
LAGETSNEDAPLRGYKILVVDDESDVRGLIASILKDNGADVTTAGDGDEAIDVARRERPDLMTLDLSMPGKSGVEVFVLLREDPDLSDMPICIITGRPEMRKLIYERPAHSPPEGYIDKPVNQKSLMRNVRKILGIRSHKV